METKVGIVIPVLNQFQKAIDAISSIKTKHNYEVVIVRQWEMRFPLAGAWNWGIEDAISRGCNRILVINDDIVFSPDTIDNLVYVLDSDLRVGMVTGCNMRETSTPHDMRVVRAAEPVSESENPDFACFMIRPETYSTVGMFDTVFNPAYFEDNSYHYRMHLLGVRAISTTAAPYYHYGSSTQNGDASGPVVSGENFEKNKSIYVRMWGGVPGAETFRTPFNDPHKKPSEGQTELPKEADATVA